jgi:hypothetical protein
MYRWEEKPAFFDLFLKPNQNCRVDIVNDTQNGYIDRENVSLYYLNEESNFAEENRDEIDNDASENDVNSLNDGDIHMLD